MITVLGSINLDLVGTCPRLPRPGETLSGSRFATAAGGKGANQALAALRAGARTQLFGAVGADDLASQALAELRADGAALDGVATLGPTTGVAMILVEDGGENVIVIIAGANGLVGADMARDAVLASAPGDFMLLQQEIPAAANRTALDLARERGLRTMLNIAPFSADSAGLAQDCDVLVANETEFGALTGVTGTGDGLADAVAARARGTAQTVVVTLGGDGIVAADASGSVMTLAAEKIAPVDTVGAGDTFCGYLGAGLDAGLDLKAALVRANRAAALACLKPGAQPAIPRAEEVDGA